MDKIGWIDSHCHICCSDFDEDFNEVIKRIEENNIARVMIICSDLNEVDKALTLVKKDKRFNLACGIHPEDISKFDEKMWKKFIAYAKLDEVSAIGEIGLDYYWDKDNHEKQKDLFIRQINLAKTLNKPIIVHSRDALQDSFDIMKAHKTRGVLHSYSGSVEMAKEFVKLGYYISLSGPVTFKNAIKPKEVAKEINLENLLIETDAPYMTPTPFRGKRNEPMYVRYTGEYIADLKGIDYNDFKVHLCNNYDNLFNK